MVKVDRQNLVMLLMKSRGSVEGKAALINYLNAHFMGLAPAAFLTLKSEWQLEIKQESLNTIWKYADYYNEELGSVSWVQAIIKSRLIDHLRKEAKHMRSSELSLHETQDVFEDRYGLMCLLDELNSDQKSLLVELKILGLSIDEYAHKYNLSVSSVKSRISRLLSQLRSKYK